MAPMEGPAMTAAGVQDGAVIQRHGEPSPGEGLGQFGVGRIGGDRLPVPALDHHAGEGAAQPGRPCRHYDTSTPHWR